MNPFDTLDLRHHALPAAVAQVLERLNRLPADHPLELRLDQDPAALRQALQAAAGRLAWAELPGGRVQLARPSQDLLAGSCCSGGACCG